MQRRFSSHHEGAAGLPSGGLRLPAECREAAKTKAIGGVPVRRRHNPLSGEYSEANCATRIVSFVVANATGPSTRVVAQPLEEIGGAATNFVKILSARGTTLDA
nr:hypothetical protein Iba_chr01bCG7810 [Ipomoea batatas]GMC51356.1 hypothetical protein Iba_chr01cCG5480 [Ipomoea batatas]